MGTNIIRFCAGLIAAYTLVGCNKPVVEDIIAVPVPMPELASAALPTPTPLPTPSPTPAVRTHSQMQADILDTAQKYVGEQEWNGYNRSKNIDKWNKYSNAPLGSPYCAAFVSWVLHEANIPDAVRSAWSPSTTAQKRVDFDDIKPADVFGMYFASKGRISHTGFIKNPKYNDTMIQTTEANTSPNAGSGSKNDRDGDGVWNKLRARSLMKNSKNKYSRYW